MTFEKEKGRSLIVGIAAGLAGAATVALFATFGMTPAGAVVPLFASLAIIVGTAHYWKTLHAQGLHDEFRQVKRRLSVLEDSIAETQGLVQLSGLNQPFPLPFGGSWALTPDAAVVLAREVVIRRPEVVVELGSGVSTLLVGRLLRQLGRGRLISLDHDPSWARETRRQVLADGLQDYVEVVDAPMVRQKFDGQAFDWYRIPEQLRDIGEIDMITVDGPPQATDTGILSRYPALPAFAEQLSEQALIYVDDASRETEQAMVKKWLLQYPGWTSRMIDTVPGTCLLERQK